MIPKSGRNVMNSRLEPLDSLDYFCTPPWATRALLAHVIGLTQARGATCWDPCAGAGHMSGVLAESFRKVHASDVFDYGSGFSVGSFVSGSLDLGDVAECPFEPDWIVMNPPFNVAEAFHRRAMAEAKVGVAMLVRINFLAGGERHDLIYSKRRPAVVAVFAERVPMVKGRWDPDASSATDYIWLVWHRKNRRLDSRTVWIPPGCRKNLEKPSDRVRYAGLGLDGTQLDMLGTAATP